MNWHTITRDGSTVRTAHGGVLLKGNDTWFAPSDVTTGPDGAVYVADWFESAPPIPIPTLIGTKVTAACIASRRRTATCQSRLGNLDSLSGFQLVDRLCIGEGWHARRALRVLAERRDEKLVPLLRKRLDATRDPVLALRLLCGLYVSGGFDEPLAKRLLVRPEEAVRAWTIRFLGDQRNVSAEMEHQLTNLAATDPSPVVLAQLGLLGQAVAGAVWPADRLCRRPESRRARRTAGFRCWSGGPSRVTRPPTAISPSARSHQRRLAKPAVTQRHHWSPAQALRRRRDTRRIYSCRRNLRRGPGPAGEAAAAGGSRRRAEADRRAAGQRFAHGRQLCPLRLRAD